jgi:hypothetical protein
MSAEPVPSVSTTDERVAAFKSDLLKMSIHDVIRKHITTGEPAAMAPDLYFELRSRVGSSFNVYPNAVVLVGSGRMGFSLKQKGDPAKRYHPFGSKSDYDVAIVSRALFDDYWDAVFDLVRNKDWPLTDGRHFARDLFSGWITPSELPSLRRFDHAKKWAELFADLTQSRRWGLAPIKGRLYRDWSRLEAYQTINVSLCARELSRSRTEGSAS